MAEPEDIAEQIKQADEEYANAVDALNQDKSKQLGVNPSWADSEISGIEKVQSLKSFEDAQKACSGDQGCQFWVQYYTEMERLDYTRVTTKFRIRNPSMPEAPSPTDGTLPNEKLTQAQAQIIAEELLKYLKKPPNENPNTADEKRNAGVKKRWIAAGLVTTAAIIAAIFKTTEKRAELAYCEMSRRVPSPGEDPVKDLQCKPPSSQGMDDYKAALAKECACSADGSRGPCVQSPSQNDNSCRDLTIKNCSDLPQPDYSCKTWSYQMVWPSLWGAMEAVMDDEVSQLSQDAWNFSKLISWIFDHAFAIGTALVVLVVMGWLMSFYRSWKSGG